MKKLILYFIASLMFFSFQAQVTQLSDPLMLGARIKESAKNANCLLVANDGGVFKTTDQGHNWTAVNHLINPTSLNCNNLVSVGSDFYIMSHSRYDGGMYKSTNDGVNWTKMNPADWSVYSLAGLSNSLYALGHNWSSNQFQLYSTSDGLTWTPKAVVWSGERPDGYFELLSFNHNRLYIRLQLDVYYTTDGDNLIPVSVNGLSDPDFEDGDLYGDALGNLYCMLNDNAIYKYNFSTQMWSDITTGKIPADYQIIGMSVTDNAIFFTAMPSVDPMKIYKSVDQGISFAELASAGLSMAFVESIIELGTNIFVGNDLYERVLLSADGGESWALSPNQPTATFAGLVKKAENSLFYLRGHLGVVRSDDQGMSWTQSNVGIPSLGDGSAYFTNQLTAISDTLFAFANPDPNSSDIALFKSSNLGLSWLASPIPSPHNLGNDYSFAGRCDKILFVNYNNDDDNPNTPDYSLIYSLNYGVSWIKPNSQKSNYPIYVKGPKDYLFAFTGPEDDGFSSIFKANSFGLSFSNLNTTVSNNLLIKRIVNENGDKIEPAMDFDSLTNKAIFVVRDQMMNNVDKLFSYDIAEEHWSEINTQGLPVDYIGNYIKCIGSNAWLLATNLGLYQSTNGGQSWMITHSSQQWLNGLEVNSMEKIGSKVFLGTISNGVWLVDLSIPFALSSTKSAYFDGSQDRIRVVDTSPINPSANPSAYQISGNAISIEAWIYPMDLPEPNEQRSIIIRPSNNGFAVEPFQTFQLLIEGNAPVSQQPRIAVAISDGVHELGSGYDIFVEDTDQVKLGEWTHVAATYDGAHVRLYINGVLANQSAFDVSMGSGSTGLYIGGASFAQNYFRGLMDEVRLWNVVRSASEIQSKMNESLIGDESGLAGYWPMEETYIATNGATATVDKTSSHNDLMVQYDAKLMDFPVGSEVLIPTTMISYSYNQSHNYAVVGEEFSARIEWDGWPAPNITITQQPEGLTQVGNSIFWTPSAHQYWWETLSTKISSPGNTFNHDLAIESEAMESTQNQIKLDLGNHGRIGTFSNYGKGLIYKTQNGLYSGSFSLIDRNDLKFAGGLYYNPYRPNEGFSAASSQFLGFDAFKTSFSDEWESDRIGVNVVLTTHSSIAAGDDKYAIIEYEVTNISENTIDDLFAQLTLDFNVGNSFMNLGAYDAANEMIYMYEPGAVNNPYYYGYTPLNCSVSGQAVFNQYGDYVRTVAPLTTFAADPTEPNEYKCQISTGPYDLGSGESKTFAFAVFAGDDLNDIQSSAVWAKQVYSHPITAVPEVEENQFNGFSLAQNYPNPFQQSTQINYMVGKQGKVSVKLYNVEGRLIEILVDEIKTVGNYSINYSGINNASGIYYYQLQSDETIITKRMVIMK